MKNKLLDQIEIDWLDDSGRTNDHYYATIDIIQDDNGVRAELSRLSDQRQDLDYWQWSCDKEELEQEALETYTDNQKRRQAQFWQEFKRLKAESPNLSTESALFVVATIISKQDQIERRKL